MFGKPLQGPVNCERIGVEFEDTGRVDYHGIECRLLCPGPPDQCRAAGARGLHISNTVDATP